MVRKKAIVIEGLALTGVYIDLPIVSDKTESIRSDEWPCSPEA